MSDNPNPAWAGKMDKNTRKLAGDLDALNAGLPGEETGDVEMLSQILDDALKGVDISTRYPDFHRKLLINPGLRRLFLDVLESVEGADQAQELELPVADLGFLRGKTPEPEVDRVAAHRWRVRWRRAIRDLQAIFSPEELAYRSGDQVLEDPWFTLVRGDVTLGGRAYSVVLECSVSEASDESLSAYLNLALTLAEPDPREAFPVQASLQWGDYRDTLVLDAEGRSRFTDIPFSAAFTGDLQTVTSDLDFRLDIPDSHA